jgi:hypothetical protein
MSDPRYFDPQPSDARYPSSPRPRDSVQVPVEDGSSSAWGWISAIAVIVVVLGLMIGYHEMGPVASDSPRMAAPTTTGAAPLAPAKPRVNQAAPGVAAPPAPDSAPQ